MSNTIQEIDKMISERKEEIKSLEEAKRVILKVVGNKASSGASTGFADKKGEDPLTPTGEIDFDKLILPQKASSGKPTLADLCKEVIGKFGGKEFTVNHVFAAMIQLGHVQDGKNVKNKISLAIRKLADEGFIIRTHEGSGNEPHKYKVKGKQVSFLNDVSNG